MGSSLSVSAPIGQKGKAKYRYGCDSNGNGVVDENETTKEVSVQVDSDGVCTRKAFDFECEEEGSDTASETVIGINRICTLTVVNPLHMNIPTFTNVYASPHWDGNHSKFNIHTLDEPGSVSQITEDGTFLSIPWASEIMDLENPGVPMYVSCDMGANSGVSYNFEVQLHEPLQYQRADFCNFRQCSHVTWSCPDAITAANPNSVDCTSETSVEVCECTDRVVGAGCEVIEGNCVNQNPIDIYFAHGRIHNTEGHLAEMAYKMRLYDDDMEPLFIISFEIFNDAEFSIESDVSSKNELVVQVNCEDPNVYKVIDFHFTYAARRLGSDATYSGMGTDATHSGWYGALFEPSMFYTIFADGENLVGNCGKCIDECAETCPRDSSRQTDAVNGFEDLTSSCSKCTDDCQCRYYCKDYIPNSIGGISVELGLDGIQTYDECLQYCQCNINCANVCDVGDSCVQYIYNCEKTHWICPDGVAYADASEANGCTEEIFTEDCCYDRESCSPEDFWPLTQWICPESVPIEMASVTNGCYKETTTSTQCMHHFDSVFSDCSGCRDQCLADSIGGGGGETTTVIPPHHKCTLTTTDVNYKPQFSNVYATSQMMDESDAQFFHTYDAPGAVTQIGPDGTVFPVELRETGTEYPPSTMYIYCVEELDTDLDGNSGPVTGIYLGNFNFHENNQTSDSFCHSQQCAYLEWTCPEGITSPSVENGCTSESWIGICECWGKFGAECEVIDGQCLNVNENFKPQCVGATIANFPAGNAAGTVYEVYLADSKHSTQFGLVFNINAGSLTVDTSVLQYHDYDNTDNAPFGIKIGCDDLDGYLLDFSFCYSASNSVTDPPHMFFSTVGINFDNLDYCTECEYLCDKQCEASTELPPIQIGGESCYSSCMVDCEPISCIDECAETCPRDNSRLNENVGEIDSATGGGDLTSSCTKCTDDCQCRSYCKDFVPGSLGGLSVTLDLDGIQTYDECLQYCQCNINCAEVCDAGDSCVQQMAICERTNWICPDEFYENGFVWHLDASEANGCTLETFEESACADCDSCVPETFTPLTQWICPESVPIEMASITNGCYKQTTTSTQCLTFDTSRDCGRCTTQCLADSIGGNDGQQFSGEIILVAHQ